MPSDTDPPPFLPEPSARAPEIALDHERPADEDARAIARALAASLQKRRSVRSFSSEPVPRELLVDCLRVATSAPSGANMQPWSFVVVTDPEKKAQIRAAAEAEERAFYSERAPDGWLKDLAPLGTGPDKAFLETAPALVAIFMQPTRADGQPNYYVRESVGIATGFLIMALHQVGLCSLTHTPSPMRFLEEVLERPSHERAYLLMPVGWPAADCRVPEIQRRAFEESVTFVDAPAGQS